MDKEKRANYEQDMVINGIHTISGYLPGQLDSVPGTVSNCIRRHNYQPQADRTFILINCNKYNGAEGLITKFSQYQDVLQLILGQLGNYGLDDFNVLRADFAFNSKKWRSFAAYSKLHRLLICCIALEKKMQNCYNANGLWTLKNLNFAVRNDSYQVENYDKFIESAGKQPYGNRLEIRSVRLSGPNIKDQFLQQWLKILDAAKNQFEAVQQEYNQNLAQIFKEDQAMDKRDRQYMSFSAFALTYRDVIFTRRQLIDLCDRLHFSGPIDKADKWRDNHSLECFTKTDIDFVTKILAEKLQNYFDA